MAQEVDQQSIRPRVRERAHTSCVSHMPPMTSDGRHQVGVAPHGLERHRVRRADRVVGRVNDQRRPFDVTNRVPRGLRPCSRVDRSNRGGGTSIMTTAPP